MPERRGAELVGRRDRLDPEHVGAAFEQAARLLLEHLGRVLDRQRPEWRHDLAGRPHRARHHHRPPGGVGRLAGDLGRDPVQLADPALGLVQLEPAGVAAEAVGEKDVAAGADRAVVERAHLAGLALVPELGRLAGFEPHAKRLVPVAPSARSQPRSASSVVEPGRHRAHACASADWAIARIRPTIDAQAVRALRRQVLVEPEPAERGRRVDRDHRLRVQPGIERMQDRDQPAHDQRVRIAGEVEARARAFAVDPRHDPDLARAALDLGRRHPQRRVERRHRPAELDHVAVAVLPVVEELEVGGDRLEAFSGQAGSDPVSPPRCRRSRRRGPVAGRRRARVLRFPTPARAAIRRA